MSSIINDKILKNIKAVREQLPRIMVWVLVAGVAMGALLILVAGASGGEMMARLLVTMMILAGVIVVSMNSFKRLESQRQAVQLFALFGLVMNVAWGILWILLTWGVAPFVVGGGCGAMAECTSAMAMESGRISLLAELAYIAVILAAFGLVASNVLDVEEFDKQKTMKPLKIMVVVGAAYETFYGILLVLSARVGSSVQNCYRANGVRNCSGLVSLGVSDNLTALAGFVAAVMIVVTLTCLIISSNEKTKRRREREAARERKSVKGE